MAVLFFTLALLGPPPASDPDHPVHIVPVADAFRRKDQLRVTLENRADRPVKVQPALLAERSNGDGTWEPVFRLRIARRCPDGDAREHPMGTACVTLAPRSRIVLPDWDFYTHGEDQCPPRPPGIRAYRGVYRLVVTPCPGSEPPFQPAVRHITWE